MGPKDAGQAGQITLPPSMRHHLVRIFKLWLLRQLTFAPLIVLLVVGFRPGFAAMTPEARWHPAFKPAGPIAAVVLIALAAGWLPFDPMALGMLLFIVGGCIGIVALGYGFDAIHVVYTPMAQAMMFAWIAAVFLVLALWRPAKILDLPCGMGASPMGPSHGRGARATPRVRQAAWLMVVLALGATGLSYALHGHEALAGFLPFLALIGARLLLKKWAQHGQHGATVGSH